MEAVAGCCESSQQTRSSRARAKAWPPPWASLPAGGAGGGGVERERGAVGDLSSADANEHLIEAAAGTGLPPDSVPAGAPLALWFLLRRPSLFREVSLRQQGGDDDPWRSARITVRAAI